MILEISEAHLNQFAHDIIKRVIAQAGPAHFIDVIVRLNAQDQRLNADWLRHLKIVPFKKIGSTTDEDIGPDAVDPVQSSKPNLSELAEKALASGHVVDRHGNFAHDNYQSLLGRVMVIIAEAYEQGVQTTMLSTRTIHTRGPQRCGDVGKAIQQQNEDK